MIKGLHNFLETIPIFAGLNDAALTELAGALEENEFSEGTVIVREGESGNRMFIIHTGRVEVVKALIEATASRVRLIDIRFKQVGLADQRRFVDMEETDRVLDRHPTSAWANPQ